LSKTKGLQKDRAGVPADHCSYENEVAHVSDIADIAVIAWEDGGQVASVHAGVAHAKAAP
jgi:hypothetical protein